MFEIWLADGAQSSLESITKPLGLTDYRVVVVADNSPNLFEGMTAPRLLMGTAMLNRARAIEPGIPKNLKLGTLRQKLFTVVEAPALFSFDPRAPWSEPERLPEIQWDLRLMSRYARTGALDPVLGDYKYVDDFSEPVEWLKANPEKPWPVSIDLETVGTDPWAPEGRIVSVAMTVRAGESFVYYMPVSGKPSVKVWQQLQWLIASKDVKLIGANLKFDIKWLWRHLRLWVMNHKFDTLLVGCLLNENRSNSLNIHTKIYVPDLGGYDDNLNAKYDKSRMDLVPKEELLPYAGGDTDAVWQVAKLQRAHLTQDTALTNFYMHLEHPASLVFAKMEHRGVYVDMERYVELRNECQKEVDTLHQQAVALLPRKLQCKYIHDLKITRDEILRDYFFTHYGLNLKPKMLTEKEKQPSTALDHLRMFRHNEDARTMIKLLEQYSAAHKTLTTYINGFMKWVRSDGKFHPDYRLARGGLSDDPESGTVTGRPSCKEPAYQTIPKRTAWAKRLREVYVPPPGHAILKLDYNQGELRIASVLSNEETMQAAYQEGKDLHSITASGISGCASLEEFQQLPVEDIAARRQAAKAVNFGLLYGMGAEGLQDYAYKSYGVDLTLQQAQEYRETYFTMYPALTVWHAQVKRLAAQNLFVRNPLGRVRHLPLIRSKFNDVRSRQERQAVNSPVQSCLSDMMKLAMIQIDLEWPDLMMFGMTFDSLEVYVPLEDIVGWARRLKEVMENLPLNRFGWEPTITFVADPEASSRSLGHLEKVTFA